MDIDKLTALLAAIAATIGAVATLITNIRVNIIRNEVSHNHGSSLKDAVARIEGNQKGLISTTNLLVKDVSSLGHQIGEIRESANVAHEDYAARLRRLEENS